MAEVWIARKAVGGKGTKYVALKFVAEHFLSDPRYARMFRAEAELAASLNHANIVQVFEHGEDAGRSFLVMEWVDGLNLLKLEERLAYVDEQRRFRLISYIIGQLLHALHYTHRIRSADGHPMGVVHRDVSPQNVLVSNNGEVKLIDFGVAHHNFDESSGTYVKGKLRYMPPEQLRGQSRSPAVDLYSVGALLHELLDGQKFRGAYEDEQDLFNAVLSGQVPPLSRRAPPELDVLRRRLLECNPMRRIQTANDALTLLRRFPGYGDARQELAELCGSATGVLEPCVAPQGMAAPATGHAAGLRRARGALGPASPSGGRPLPPPSPPSLLSAPNGPLTGASTQVKVRGGTDQPISSPWRTGETQVIELRAPPPETAHGASPWQPQVGESTASSTAEPFGWSSGVALHVPLRAHEVGTSGSRACSGTDHDIVAPVVVGDGTATMQDLPGMLAAAPSGDARLWKRSALALFGLLFVSTASIPAVWMAGRGDHSDVTMASMDPMPVEPRPTWPWPLLFSQVSKGPIGVPPRVEPSSNHVTETSSAAVAEADPDTPSPVSGVTGVTGVAEDRSTPSTSRVDKRAKSPTRIAKLKVMGGPALKHAQVKVGTSKPFRVGSRVHEIPSGTWTIRWREAPDKDWKTRPSRYHFAAGKRWIIDVSMNGPSIREDR